MIDETLAQQIREANIRVHRQEAPTYEQLHPEIFNWYEQRWLKNDLALIEWQLLRAGGPVLDVGCGTGNLTLKLAALGHRVDALDISEEMLLILKSRASDQITLICSDVDSFLAGIQKTYDLISFSSVLHHLPDYRASLVQAVRRLNAGGFVYITHEPLQRSLKPGLHRQLSKVSEYWYRLSLKLAGVAMGTIDYTLSDYHAQAGIDAEDLVARLRQIDLEILRQRYYYVERLGLVAFINNEILKGGADSFSLIAQKRF